jgi:hypothetical protein
MYPRQNAIEFDSERSQEDINFEEGYLAALTVEPKKVLPCFVKLRTGKCVKGTACNFDHSDSVLRQAWKDEFKAIQDSPYNPRITTRPSVSAMHSADRNTDASSVDPLLPRPPVLPPRDLSVDFAEDDNESDSAN